MAQKEIRNLLDDLTRQGATIRQTKHTYHVVHPDGGIAGIPTTPGDYRARLNTRADLRRIGFATPTLDKHTAKKETTTVTEPTFLPDFKPLTTMNGKFMPARNRLPSILGAIQACDPITVPSVFRILEDNGQKISPNMINGALWGLGFRPTSQKRLGKGMTYTWALHPQFDQTRGIVPVHFPDTSLKVSSVDEVAPEPEDTPQRPETLNWQRDDEATPNLTDETDGHSDEAMPGTAAEEEWGALLAEAERERDEARAAADRLEAERQRLVDLLDAERQTHRETGEQRDRLNEEFDKAVTVRDDLRLELSRANTRNDSLESALAQALAQAEALVQQPLPNDGWNTLDMKVPEFTALASMAKSFGLTIRVQGKVQ